MPIVDRNLKPRTRLVATYRKQQYRAEVVAGEDGKPRYRLEDGREFKSPSAAGSAIMAGRPCNGWTFWSIAKEEAAPQPAAEQSEGKPGTQPASKPRAKKGKHEKEANATVDVDCRCLSYQPGSAGCKLEESGDCQPV